MTVKNKTITAFARMLLFAIVAASAASAATRPLAGRYGHVGAPFGVFYNPAVITDNSGHTVGADVRFASGEDYDLRGALTIPLGALRQREEHVERFGEWYHNAAYRSSRTAISAGGIFSSEFGTQISAGLAIPVGPAGFGASVDMLNFGEDEEQSAALNVGFSSGVPALNGIFLLGIHNAFVTNGRDNRALLGVSVGIGGAGARGTSAQNLPCDLTLRVNFRDTLSFDIDNVEGALRFVFDLSRAHTSRERVGNLITASAGVNFLHRRGEDTDYGFFAGLGVIFVNRSSMTAAAAGYADGAGHGGEARAAIFHAMDLRRTLGGGGMSPAINAAKTDAGILFGLSGAPQDLQSWILRIDDEHGRSVRTFSGGNVMPSSILWDGKNQDGTDVSGLTSLASASDETSGVVFARLILTSETRVAVSEVVRVRVF